MSWSVSAIGKPFAVKAALAVQFAVAKSSTQHIAQECDAVAAIEAAVNSQLDFLADVPEIAVHVRANGSVHKHGTSGSANCSLTFETIHGFKD